MVGPVPDDATAAEREYRRYVTQDDMPLVPSEPPKTAFNLDKPQQIDQTGKMKKEKDNKKEKDKKDKPFT